MEFNECTVSRVKTWPTSRWWKYVAFCVAGYEGARGMSL